VAVVMKAIDSFLLSFIVRFMRSTWPLVHGCLIFGQLVLDAVLAVASPVCRLRLPVEQRVPAKGNDDGLGPRPTTPRTLHPMGPVGRSLTNCVSSARGAAVKNLSQSASLHSKDKIAPKAIRCRTESPPKPAVFDVEAGL